MWGRQSVDETAYQPRRFDTRVGGSERQFRNAVRYCGAGSN
jgi:hypothetical protein